jgi:5-methyltetrahydropteroyltriglutamate--homocysteine methyltransferase
VLSLGVIDGRNIWRDLSAILARSRRAGRERPGATHVILAPSCSLLHTPIDLDRETALDPEIRRLARLRRAEGRGAGSHGRALNEGRDAVRSTLDAAIRRSASRRTSPRINNPAVQKRRGTEGRDTWRRKSAFAARAACSGPG